jgi:hypothetical protein
VVSLASLEASQVTLARLLAREERVVAVVWLAVSLLSLCCYNSTNDVDLVLAGLGGGAPAADS